MSFIIRNSLPSANVFCAMRREVTWGEITLMQAEGMQAEGALSASLCGVSLWDDKDCIGIARVIGDGVLNLYIQDVIITKAYRGQGLGAELLGALIPSLKQDYPQDCTIGLMAAKGQAPFYVRFGFQPRPSQSVDAGMSAQLGQLRLG